MSFPRFIYHFLPDRFCRTDGKDPAETNFGEEGNDMFFGGSLLGAQTKLPYIRALGFDGVLVGPFLANQPAAYHGYHAIDSDHVDPRFFGVDGDGRDVLVQRENMRKEFEKNEDTLPSKRQKIEKTEVKLETPFEKQVRFETELINKLKPVEISKLQEFYDSCHKNGLQVIFDLVPNHLYKYNKLIVKAKETPEMRDWFFLDEQGHPTKFFFTYTDLVKVNLRNKDAAAMMTKHALELAQFCDHFRIDHAIGCDKTFLINLGKEVKKNKPNFKLIGEIWLGDFTETGDELYKKFVDSFDMFSNEEKDYLLSHRCGAQSWATHIAAGLGNSPRCLDGMFDFEEYFNVEKSLKSFDAVYTPLQRNIPSDFLLIKFVDNHDTDRASYLLSVAIDEWVKRKEEERINGTIRKSVLKGDIIVQEQANQPTNSRGQCIDQDNKGKEGELSPKHFLTDGEKERIIVHKLFSIFKALSKCGSLSVYSGTECGEIQKDSIKNIGDNYARIPINFKDEKAKDKIRNFLHVMKECGALTNESLLRDELLKMK